MPALNTAACHLNSLLPILDPPGLNCMSMDKLYLLTHFFPAYPQHIGSCSLIKGPGTCPPLVIIQDILPLVIVIFIITIFVVALIVIAAQNHGKCANTLNSFSTYIHDQFKSGIYWFIIPFSFGKKALLSLPTPKFSSALLLKSLCSFKSYASILGSISA